jgi:hypothetical protein
MWTNVHYLHDSVVPVIQIQTPKELDRASVKPENVFVSVLHASITPSNRDPRELHDTTRVVYNMVGVVVVTFSNEVGQESIKVAVGDRR